MAGRHLQDDAHVRTHFTAHGLAGLASGSAGDAGSPRGTWDLGPRRGAATVSQILSIAQLLTASVSIGGVVVAVDSRRVPSGPWPPPVKAQ